MEFWSWGGQFLKKKGLYDAMPAFWRRMPVKSCHDFFDAVDNRYANKPKGSHDPVWPKSNFWTLINSVCLEDLSKSRACYLAVKRYPLVLCTTRYQDG